jgi:hypothetical protein
MATVKQLKDQIRKHNLKQCIRLTQRKAGLISSLSSVKGGGAPAPALIAPAHQQKKKKKKRMALQTTPFGTGGPSASAFGAGGGSSPNSKKKKKKSGFLPSNSAGQQSFNTKMDQLKKKSKKGKGKDSAPDLAFGNAFSGGYV